MIYNSILVLVSIIGIVSVITNMYWFLNRTPMWHTPHANFFPTTPIDEPRILDSAIDHAERIKKYGFSWASCEPVWEIENDGADIRWVFTSPHIDPPEGFCWHGSWQNAYPYIQRKLLAFEV